MRTFRVGRTQLHRMRSILNGSRKYYFALALAGVLMSSPLMLHTKAQTGFMGAGTYSIRSKSSGRMLDIETKLDFGQANGHKLTLWDSHGGSNQQFLIESVGNGYWTIRALHSRKLLDVEGASTADSAGLQQYQENGGDNQRFSIEPVDCNFYLIRAKHSQKVLDARGAGENGSQILQYGMAPGRDNQLFSFTRLP